MRSCSDTDIDHKHTQKTIKTKQKNTVQIRLTSFKIILFQNMFEQYIFVHVGLLHSEDEEQKQMFNV